MTTPDISADASPIWQALLRQLSALPPHSFLADENPPVLPEAPWDWHPILTHDPAIWSALYERCLEAHDRQRRRTGARQTGVFFTPLPLARYLLQQTLGQHLQAAKEGIQAACQQRDRAQAQKHLEASRQLNLIDPACGTGVFLIEALELLHAFYQDVQMLWQQAGWAWVPVFAWQQVAGIELDFNSAAVTRMRLMQWVWQHDRYWPHPQDLRIQTANTLIDTVFATRPHWDFVVGNPPYLSEVRGEANRFRALQNASPYYQAKMDLCDAFLAWGIAHVKPDGQLAYVLPEYWTQRSSTAPLRQTLLHTGHLQELWQLGSGIFPNAPGHHTALLIWQKTPTSEPHCHQGTAHSLQEVSEKALSPARYHLDRRTQKLVFSDARTADLLNRLSTLAPLLQPAQIQQGIVLPQGRLRKSDCHKLGLPLDSGLFLLTPAELEQLRLNTHEQAWIRPYYGPTGFQQFQGFTSPAPHYWLIYANMAFRRALTQTPEHYPNLRAHLDRLAAVNTSTFAPYGLHRARQPIWFEAGAKIFSPRQVAHPAFALVAHAAYVGEGFYSILPGKQDPHWLCGLLNSDLARFWFYQQKRKGERLQIDKDVLVAFPAPPKATTSERDALAALVHQLRTQTDPTQRTALYQSLNQIVCTLYGLTDSEAHLITTPGHRPMDHCLPP